MRRPSRPHRDLSSDLLLAGATSAASARLLVAALEPFATRGFHATTTRDISIGSGMSAAALYVHFPSKEAALFEMVRMAHEAALAVFRTAIASSDDSVERLGCFTFEFTAWHARHHRLARVAQYELAALTPEHFAVVAALRRELEQAVRAEIREGIRNGAFTVPDVDSAALAVLSLGIDVVRWFRSGGRLTPEALAGRYRDLSMRMLGAG